MHDLVTCLHAPTVALSSADGQIRPLGAQGVFAADLRVLGRAELTVDGQSPESISTALIGAGAADFLAAVRRPGGPTRTRRSWLRRRRRVRADGMDETIELRNVSDRAVQVLLRLSVATDLATMEAVKKGLVGAPAVPVRDGSGVRFTAPGLVGAVSAVDAELELLAGAAAFSWTLTVPPRSTAA